MSGFDNFAHLQNFALQTLITATVAAVAIKIAMNTLTLSCYIGKEFQAPPTSAMDGASKCVDLIWKSPFYASFWRLTVWDRRLVVAFYVGSMGWSAYKPSWKAKTLTGLECWQVEKWQKSRFAQINPLSQICSHFGRQCHFYSVGAGAYKWGKNTHARSWRSKKGGGFFFFRRIHW